MVKITGYSGYGICSLCGAEKPSKQLQYTSPSRKATIPLCDECCRQYEVYVTTQKEKQDDRVDEQKLHGKNSKNAKQTKQNRADNRDQQR